MNSILKEFEEKFADFNKVKKEFFEKFKEYREKIISSVVEKLENEDKEGEEIFYKLLEIEGQISPREYGFRLEEHMFNILKGIFAKYNIERHRSLIKNKIEDIIIYSGDKKVVVEVKSFIDNSEKSPQSIEILQGYKRDIEGLKDTKYLVFASCQSTKDAFEKWKEFHKEWIFLQSYYDGKNYTPIWKCEGFKDYYPLTKLIETIKEFLK